MRLTTSSRHSSLALTLLFATTAALAQMSPMGGGMGGGHGGRMHNRNGASPDAAVISAANPEQQRFSELEAKLKLTEAQWPLWETYQEKVSALHADLQRAPSGAVIAKDNAVQQIDRKADVLRDRLAAMEDISDAAHALYKTFTVEQKAVADSLLAATVPSLYDSFNAPQRDGSSGNDSSTGGRHGNRNSSPPPGGTPN